MSATTPETYFGKLGEFPHAAFLKSVTHAWEASGPPYGFRQKLVMKPTAPARAAALRVRRVSCERRAARHGRDLKIASVGLSSSGRAGGAASHQGARCCPGGRRPALFRGGCFGPGRVGSTKSRTAPFCGAHAAFRLGGRFGGGRWGREAREPRAQDGRREKNGRGKKHRPSRSGRADRYRPHEIRRRDRR